MVLPKEFPVYLWQPFLRHGYFSFHEAADQRKFSALLSDCIRHVNHGRTWRPHTPRGAALLRGPGQSPEERFLERAALGRRGSTVK